jgi:indolepyruvate ferredoxin oxidoreductase beta subunit
MVRSGTADLLIALKAEESYKNLHFLGEKGTLLFNAPPEFELIAEVADALAAKQIRIERYDATGHAVEIGNPVAANLVLLSAAVNQSVLPADRAMLVKAVENITPPKRLEGNLKAIEAGEK